MPCTAPALATDSLQLPPLISNLRGLYPSFSSRKQELQEWSHSPRPRRFIVLRAFHWFVIQTLLRPPTLGQQHIAKSFHIVHDPRAFLRADIQPDPRQRLPRLGIRKSQNHSPVPPHPWRQRRHFSEHVRQLQS